MAIIKKAKNINIQIKHNYVSITGNIEKTAKQLIVYSTNEELSLNCNKQIVSYGNK